jgi:precorrin-2 dehydrogenase/sirohydrochlorin ferrochelatase
MLDIRGRKAVVIGGDRVAAQKAAALTASGAEVSVIGQQFCDELLQQAAHHRVKLVRKSYAPGDLAGAFVVIAATSDPQMIETIWEETQERGQLVNIVDVPERCTFIMPSVLRRDQLTIAVSTEGASPSLAKRIRQRLEDYFPPAYGSYMRLAALARTHLRQQGVSYEKRDDFFEDYFTSPILSLLGENDVKQATTLTSALLQRYSVTVPAEELETELAREIEGVGDAV